jgi:hypothetical protein
MKSKLIQCGLCKREMAAESCELATVQTVVDGEKHVFCCEACARNYQKKEREQTARTK